MGMPSSYTQDKADAICLRLSEGESLRSICADDDMPKKATVMRWLSVNEAFRDQYAHAREQQVDSIFEEMLDIADDGRRDYSVGEDGREVVDHDHIQRAKLRVETRKWMLGKMAPKKYGDRLDLNHGGQKDNPIMALIAEVSGSTFRPVTEDE